MHTIDVPLFNYKVNLLWLMDINKFINDNLFRIPRHLFFWVVMYLDEVLSFFGITEPLDNYLLNGIAFSCDVVLVYFNFYFLMPKYLNKKFYGKYLCFTILTLVINLATLLFIEAYFYNEIDTFFEDIFTSFLYTSGLLGIALCIKISKLNYQESKYLATLQQLQHQTELKNLRKQLHPHFMFNTLNSIYVLAKKNHATTPESILKLADLMRYQTYEALKDEVRLSQEIDFIEKYLNLEKIRRDNLKISIQTNSDIANISLPPLLFLPFVENACKHSNSAYSKNNFINIQFYCDGVDLYFEIENNKGKQNSLLQNEVHSGLGLENIKKRMQLLYKNNYSLKIKETPSSYKVKLIINN